MTTTSWRPAETTEAEALRDLERESSLAALGTLFPPDRFPYPDEPVRQRWEEVLVEPSVRVRVCADDRGLLGFVAFDDELVRHLGVRPDAWGRGLGTEALELALAESTARRLWCLQDNERAIRLYRHRGWEPTGRTQPVEWPPHPVEVELGVSARRP